MKRTTIRKGSLADKFIRSCNWMDNTAAGHIIAGSFIALGMCALILYGMQCTHPFM